MLSNIFLTLNFSKFRYWKLNQKINFVLSLTSGIIILTIALLAYIAGEYHLKKQSFEHLTSIKESRKRYLQHYFDQIKGQLLTQAESITIINAFNDFNNAFTSLQNNLTQSAALEVTKEANQKYYENEFLPRLNKNLSKTANVNFFLPRDKVSNYLQYHYISANDYETGKKEALNYSVNDSSSYSLFHKKYHPVIKNFLNEFSYYDIFLVNNEGYIIYSVFKEVDFATNLISGPYSQTNFAKAFKAANSSIEKNEIALLDFETYLPSYSAPASFIATPIYNGDKKEGVLVFQMPVDQINDIMTGNRNWKAEGQGETGECYAIGNDMKMRSQPRVLQEDTLTYLSKLKETGIDNEIVSKISKMNNAILLQTVSTLPAKESIQGRSGVLTTTNYLGTEVLSAYSNIELLGLNWSIISEISVDEALAPAKSIRNNMLLISVVLLLVVNYFSRFLSSSIARPLIKIEKSITKVAKGILPKLDILPGKDEISAINNALFELVDVQKNIATFSENIGKGNFDTEFSPRSEEDSLGKALIDMKSELLDSKKAADKRKWSNEGISRISDLMRKNDNLEDAANKVVIFLAKYVDASVIGIYLAETDEGEITLDLKACYAYDREKIKVQKIKAGFGLIGQVFLEGKTTCLSNVPENYVSIRSGLGDSPPRFVSIIPLVYNEKVTGVLELAAFKAFPDYVIDFLEKVAENVAATIINLHNSTETQLLLEKSRQRAEELREKEYLMQQYVEELEAARETFKLKENRLKKEITQLKEHSK